MATRREALAAGLFPQFWSDTSSAPPSGPSAGWWVKHMADRREECLQRADSLLALIDAAEDPDPADESRAWILSIDDGEYRWFQAVYLEESGAVVASQRLSALFPGISLRIDPIRVSPSIVIPSGYRAYRKDWLQDGLEAKYPVSPLDWDSLELAGLASEDWQIAEDGHHIFAWLERKYAEGDLVIRPEVD